MGHRPLTNRRQASRERSASQTEKVSTVKPRMGDSLGHSNGAGSVAPRAGQGAGQGQGGDARAFGHTTHFGHTAQRKMMPRAAVAQNRRTCQITIEENTGDRGMRTDWSWKSKEKRGKPGNRGGYTTQPIQPSPFSKCENTQKSHRCILEMVVSWWGSLEQFVELKQFVAV